MLRTIRDNWNKSKAATLVEKALNISPMPYLLPEKPAIAANRLVEVLWANDPRMFDGTHSPRPSPITVAAAALTQGILDSQYSKVMLATYCGALRRLLHEVRQNRYHYALNGPDIVLLDLAEDTLIATANDDDLWQPPQPKVPSSEVLAQRGSRIDERLKVAKQMRERQS